MGGEVCVSTSRQKIIENDGECSVGRMGDGEPFSVCQFFPKLSQFGWKLCQIFCVFVFFAIFFDFCVTISWNCANVKFMLHEIVINRDKLSHFLILSTIKSITFAIFHIKNCVTQPQNCATITSIVPKVVSPNHKNVSPNLLFFTRLWFLTIKHYW